MSVPKGTPGRRKKLQRLRIFERDGWRCVKCGEAARALLTIDHIVPKSRGGPREDWNLQTLCQPCNLEKGDTLPPLSVRAPRLTTARYSTEEISVGQPQDREWTVDLRARDPETGARVFDEDYATEATVHAYIELATIQHREGGTFIVAPLRTQVPAPAHALVDGPVWANIGLVVKHAFAPPVRRQEPFHTADVPNGQSDGNGRAPIENPVFTPEPEMRDADEAEVAQALEGDEPAGVVPQGPDPMVDVDAEQSRLSAADLMPRVQ